MMKEFNVAKDFSRTPSARTEEEGKNPGEKLREMLTPIIKECVANKEKLTVILDGTMGYGTSFLEEVFGGLIRVEKLSYDEIKNTLVYVSDEEPYLIDEIEQDIQDAAENENN